MIPDYLLQLACAEFATRESAIKASPYGQGTIVWEQFVNRDPLIEQAYQLNQIPLTSIEVERRQLILRRLPSGFWAFVPDDADTIAIVAEHKQASSNFERTQMMYVVYRLPIFEERKNPDEFARRIEYATKTLRQQLMYKFAELVDEERIYRVSIVKTYRQQDIYKELVFTLLYAPELPGQSDLSVE